MGQFSRSTLFSAPVFWKRSIRMLSWSNSEIEASLQRVPIKVSYKDVCVGEYIADILVEGKVVIELKAVDKLENIHEAQVLNYLKATATPVGLLVNFKHPKAEIKRFIFTMPEGHGDS